MRFKNENKKEREKEENVWKKRKTMSSWFAAFFLYRRQNMDMKRGEKNHLWRLKFITACVAEWLRREMEHHLISKTLHHHHYYYYCKQLSALPCWVQERECIRDMIFFSLPSDKKSHQTEIARWGGGGWREECEEEKKWRKKKKKEKSAGWSDRNK